MRPTIGAVASPIMRPVIGGRRRSAGNPVLSALLARSLVCGRDGSVTQNRPTQSVNVMTGGTLATTSGAQPATVANTTIHNLDIGGGLSIPLFGSFRQRTNISNFARCAAGENGTLTAGTYIADTSTSIHRAAGNFLGTFPNATAVTSRFFLRGLGTTRFLVLKNGLGMGQICVDLQTATVAAQSGSAVVSVSAMGTGVLVRAQYTTTGTGDFGYVQMTPTATLADVLFAGNNVDGFYSETHTEVGTIVGPFVLTAGAAVTHNADDIRWAVSIPGAADYTLVHFLVKYFWQSNAAGRIATLTGAASGNNSWRVETPSGSNALTFSAGTGPTASIAAALNTTLAERVAIAQSRVNASGLVGQYNATVSGLAASAAMTAVTGLAVGGSLISGAAGQEVIGLHGMLAVPGGLTTPENDALLLCAGKTVTFGA